MQICMRIYLKFLLFIFFSFGVIHASHSDYLAEYFKEASDSFTLVELQGGLSSAKNYKVTFEGKDYVLRVLNLSASFERRQEEIKAATCAGVLNIGPYIRYVDHGYNAIIMDFVNGQTLSRSLLKQKEMLRSFIQTMKCLHQYSGEFPKGEIVFEKIKLRLERLKQSEIPFPTEEISSALNMLISIEEKFRAEELVPCHNDLSALNVIEEEGVFKFIDWTGAGMGYIYNDLGFFLLVNGIEEDRYSEILNIYLERVASERELHLLKLMVKVNMLRIFASNFPAYEFPISDKELRIKREAQLREILWDDDLPSLGYFFDLHMNGQLNRRRDVIVAYSLRALRSFVGDVLENGS